MPSISHGMVAAMLTMPWLMLGIAPGFTDQPDKFALSIDLTRLTFPYLTFMALVALMGGMLNSLQRFAATAAARERQSRTSHEPPARPPLEL